MFTAIITFSKICCSSFKNFSNPPITGLTPVQLKNNSAEVALLPTTRNFVFKAFNTFAYSKAISPVPTSNNVEFRL